MASISNHLTKTVASGFCFNELRLAGIRIKDKNASMLCGIERINVRVHLTFKKY